MEKLCEKLNLGSHSLDVRTMVRLFVIVCFHYLTVVVLRFVSDVSFVYALSKCSVLTLILLDRFDNNDLACCDSFTVSLTSNLVAWIVVVRAVQMFEESSTKRISYLFVSSHMHSRSQQ